MFLFTLLWAALIICLNPSNLLILMTHTRLWVIYTYFSSWLSYKNINSSKVVYFPEI
jgi:hypothetical protein